MCTVTVHRDGTELCVTMNRDEARTRGPERAPELRHLEDAPAWLAPRDSDSGGTWMGVNEAGLVACLLNRYQDYNPALLPDNPKSRGTIVPTLLRHRNVAQGRAWLSSEAFAPEMYPPFTVLLLDRTAGLCIDWPGHGTLQCTPLDTPWHMMTSSFFDPDTVLPWRRAAFDAWLADGATHTHGIPAFHVYQPEGKADIAPLMARDISCTRSITQVHISGSDGQITLRHGAVVESEVQWEELALRHGLDSSAVGSARAR